ncbi:phosphoglycerate kinase [Candidatus Comchoanobacter bicostacola]|uniref:Phosphoglycerate kinase n=1 Tax=Candidatus Comchoanobacter bicostacola TaxID=2919598 RepID=A0ABY5DJM2_9GAMM|nr:phosphoglycerate kinase [Candidatus Comchoanobacter bicostacola]UTC24509.1 phosphoglycerate kinase [Candidatus Comchoanobacter bicostacola]
MNGPQGLKGLTKKSVLIRSDLIWLGLSKMELKRHGTFRHCIETIQVLLSQGCSVRVLFAIGNPFLPNSSVCMRTVCQALATALECPVDYVPVSELAKKELKLGSIQLTDDACISEGEKNVSQRLVQQWLQKIDAIVLVSLNNWDTHYASTKGLKNSGVPLYLGKSLQSFDYWIKTLPGKKIGLLLGGSQVASQLDLAKGLSSNLAYVGLGHVFLSACFSEHVFDALFDQSVVDALNQLSLDKKNVLYPYEVVVYDEALCRSRICVIHDIGPNEQVKDICLRTVDQIIDRIKEDVDVVICAGVLGQYSDPRFARGTDLVLQALAQSKSETVLVGKDIISAAVLLGLSDQFDYLIEGTEVERALISGVVSEDSCVI